MIHFLRNTKGQTLIECEAMDEDLSASMYVWNYTMEVLNRNKQSTTEVLEFARAMDDLDEIRGLWWEKASETEDWKSIDAFVAHHFKAAAKKYDLKYVTD
jgi:hypothetical protein